MNKVRLFIFLRAMLIVLLSTSNIIFISNKMYVAAIITGAGISVMWTLNVKDLSIGSWGDRIAYVLGGIVGTSTSLFTLNHYLN